MIHLTYSVIFHLRCISRYCWFIFLQLSLTRHFQTFHGYENLNYLIKIHEMQEDKGFVNIAKWLNILFFFFELYQKKRGFWTYKDEDGLVNLVWFLDAFIFEILINFVSQMASRWNFLTKFHLLCHFNLNL